MSTSNNETNLIDVRGLTTYYPVTEGVIINRMVAQVHAVENVTFHIKKGETLSLVGESGCGKTTTGRTIIGLEKLSAGEMFFEGLPLSEFNSDDRKSFCQKVQMIFQDPYSSLNPRITVAEALAEPLKVHNLVDKSTIEERVADLLRKVDLPPEFGQRYPHEFSGGQRQRISIARALALDPKLIICDEAVSALDVTIKAQVINLLMNLQEQLGLTYLFISHDLAVVERISHRIAVMYLGQIVEMGSRKDIFENPTHSYTKNLLSAVPVADPRLRRSDRALEADEIPSVIKDMKYVPQLVSHEEISPGHYVAIE